MVKVDDNILIDSYNKHENVWEVGKDVGLSGQQVYSRLKKLGVVKIMNLWTKKDDDILKKSILLIRCLTI